MALLADALTEYCRIHSTAPGPLLDELERHTRSRFPEQAGMLSGPHEAALLRLLIQMSGTRRALEVGLFTGYSALAIALALPEDGTLLSCEIDPGPAAVAQRFFDRAGAGRKIHIRLGPAIDTLEALARDEPFDFAFLDADKENYVRYYEVLRHVVRPGGLIVADNTLWSGEVLAPKSPAGLGIAAFNRRVCEDPQDQVVVLPLRDGVTVIRRAPAAV